VANNKVTSLRRDNGIAARVCECECAARAQRARARSRDDTRFPRDNEITGSPREGRWKKGPRDKGAIKHPAHHARARILLGRAERERERERERETPLDIVEPNLGTRDWRAESISVSRRRDRSDRAIEKASNRETKARSAQRSDIAASSRRFPIKRLTFSLISVHRKSS